MPLLEAYSLWAPFPPAPPVSFVTALTITPSITCSVTNVQSGVAQGQVINLYSQNPESESGGSFDSSGVIAETIYAPIALPAPVTINIFTPVGTTLTFTSSSTPPVTNPTLGQYQLFMGQTLQGRYGFTWYANGVPIWSGEFSAAGKSA